MNKKLFLLLLFVSVTMLSVRSELLWDFRGGVSYGSYENLYGESKSAFNYLGELGVDIPIKDKYAIEVALRYKNVYHADSYKSYNFENYEGEAYNKAYWSDGDIFSYWYDGYDEPKFDGRASLLELPVRFGYKIPLSTKSLLRVGAGPYVSFGLNNGFRYYQSGISTAVTFEYRKINVGLNYNIAVHNAFDKFGHDGVFLTFGIKFKSSAWKSIGIVAAAVGGTALAVSSVIAESENGTSTSAYGSTSVYGDVGSADAGNLNDSSSGASLKTQYKNWERRAKANYESLTNTGIRVTKGGKNKGGTNGESLNSGNYTRQKKALREAQNEMKKIRRKAQKQGINIPESEYETVVVKY